ncbi:unnamed protein product [Anisakis simplex]|uniref:Calcineurin-like phosphoesterase domain-containing protein n=1 Tax=Anisakis simplex TaxID=6269 RepID=A0A3P6RJM8_ANISI|nr:unnamed protein product [Anisakis simplex]
MIVADPQLIGYTREPTPFSSLTRWDSDRYLRMGFERALTACHPDLILFLGDLMDEGVHASKVDFDRTLERFNAIFRTDKPVQRIYVPGDNDIGGEEQMIMPYSLNRFSNSFSNSFEAEALGLDAISFVQINPFNGAQSILWVGSSAICVVLSHGPIIRFPDILKNVRSLVSPALILSAHSHTASYYEEVFNGAQPFKSISMLSQKTSHTVAIDEHNSTFKEFQTATCNYRMGVDNMAYGCLTFTRNNATPRPSFNVRYTALWLPRRFHQLAIYFFIVVVLTIYGLRWLFW